MSLNIVMLVLAFVALVICPLTGRRLSGGSFGYFGSMALGSYALGTILFAIVLGVTTLALLHRAVLALA